MAYLSACVGVHTKSCCRIIAVCAPSVSHLWEYDFFIYIFHICNAIIIEAPTVLFELNYGAILEMHIDCGVNFLANILSFTEVMSRFCITFDIEIDSTINVHLEDSTIIQFK